MKTTVLILFLLSLATSAWSANIVLLTSLPLKDQKLEKRTEKIFTKRFLNSQDTKLIILHKADQEILFKHLNDPETKALFWVSHGAGVSKRPEVLTSVPMLLDHEGNNVAGVFGKVNPHLRYLAVVGCQSAQILKDILPVSANLKTYLPAKKIIGEIALKKAIKQFKDSRFSPVEGLPLSTTETFPITITRSMKSGTKAFKSFQVHIGGKLAAIFPGSKDLSSQKLTIHHPIGNNLKIILETGQNPGEEENYFGEVNVTSDRFSWKLFAKPDGEAFGVSERIFFLEKKKQ